jgi:hypothetical protein
VLGLEPGDAVDVLAVAGSADQRQGQSEAARRPESDRGQPKHSITGQLDVANVFKAKVGAVDTEVTAVATRR